MRLYSIPTAVGSLILAWAIAGLIYPGTFRRLRQGSAAAITRWDLVHLILSMLLCLVINLAISRFWWSSG